MMKKKTRGAVSVFLVMILVPCMLVSSIFVDVSRMYLAQGMAESASDLALNALLTKYDADLSDWYGMMASCQNIEEVYSKSAEIFLRILSSQDLSEEEIKNVIDYGMHTFSDQDINDLLRMEPQGDVTVGAVDGADLTNPTILKDQIVEFMKYRAPVELTSTLIGRLAETGDAGNTGITDVLESDENSELVEDKQAFYEAEGELCEKAFRSYVAIFDYYRYASGNHDARGNQKPSMNSEALKSYADRLTEYKKAYQEIHELMIKNFYNTEGLVSYTRTTVNSFAWNFTYGSNQHATNFEQITKSYRKDEGTDANFKEIYSEKEETDDGETVYYIYKSDLEALMNDLFEAENAFKEARERFVSKLNDLMGKLPGDGDDDSYLVQWWVQANKVVNNPDDNIHQKLRNASEDLVRAYAKILALEDCTPYSDSENPTDNVPSNWLTGYRYYSSYTGSSRTYAQIKQNIKTSIDTFLINQTGSSNYHHYVYNLEDYSKAACKKIDPSKVNLSTKINGTTYSVQNAVPAVKSALTNMRMELQEYVDLLNKAIDGYGDKDATDRIPSLDELLTLANNYQVALDEYTNTVKNTDTTVAREEEEKFLDNADEIEWRKEITQERVQELKTRLTNIRSQYQTIIDAIDSMTYGGTKLTEISTFAKVKELAGSKVQKSEIKLTNRELKDYAQKTFTGTDALFQPTETVLTLQHLEDYTYNPDINPDENNTVHTPELFVIFHKLWKGKSVQDLDDVKEEEEKTKEESDKYVEEQKGLASKYRGEGEDITVEYSNAGTDFGVGSALGSLITLFTNLLDGRIDNLRDDIYVTTYAMNMFSYATYDREGMYSLLSDEQKKSMGLSNYDDDDHYGGVSETWFSEEMKDSSGNFIPNKTVTNKLITQSNNAAYLAEIEYLLYGGTNEENLKSSFGALYEIRFVLNLISGFQHYWSDAFITGVASFLQGCTMGIVPAAVFKAVLIPILTAIETCVDNQRLAAGMPVELYKGENDWWICIWKSQAKDKNIGFSAFLNLLKGEPIRTNQDKGLFYSDYMTLFVYLGFSSGNQDNGLAANMYRRMAELIQANMRKHEGVSDSFSMGSAKVYFKLEATLRIKPIMVSLPVFGNSADPMTSNLDWCTFQISTVRGYS